MSKVLVAGAGGFIGGHLVKYLLDLGYYVRAVDIKHRDEWFQYFRDADNKILNLQNPDNCRKAVKGIDYVFNLAADMGGMGFIEQNPVECMRNVLINTNLIEESYKVYADKYFFASSACVYNQALQSVPGKIRALKETDAYPADAERGYGWEKLFSELVCQEYYRERGVYTYIARFHNVYGPHGTWCGGREKAPAAICRKVAEAVMIGRNYIEIWGDGNRTRSFTYIDDCITGIYKIINCDDLISLPINLGSSEMVSIDKLVDIVEEIAGVKLDRIYKPDAPKGVFGRNSDNTLIKNILNWEPSTPLKLGLEKTYEWIYNQRM